MKIAMIGQKGIPATIGGIERYVEELSVRLAKHGHDVTVYTRPHFTPANRKHYFGVTLKSLPSIATKHFDAISHTLVATLHALGQGYDVIHYHGVGPAILSIIPRLFLRRTRVVVTFQCLDRKHAKWGVFAQMVLWFGEWAAVTFPHETITVTKTLTRYCWRAYRRRTTYITNGSSMSGRYRAPNIIAKSFGLKPQGYILSASRLIPHKRIEDVIRAFRGLRTTKRLVIAGDGFHTDTYVAKLHRLAAGDSRIVFVGRQEGQALEELYANAYLFVLPSSTEGLSLALLEAMGYAVAPLVSNIPENAEVIQESAKPMGWMYPLGNVSALRRRLADLLASPRLAAEAGVQARLVARTRFHWDVITTAILKLYRADLEEVNRRLPRRYRSAIIKHARA